jgi:hypothetical protein
MPGRPCCRKKIRRESKIADPNNQGLMKRSKNLQQKHGQQKGEIDRQNPQRAANVKFSQADAAGQIFFLQQQISYQKSADDKKTAHAQVSVKQPVKNSVKAFGKSGGDFAVRAEHHDDARRAPAVQ